MFLRLLISREIRELSGFLIGGSTKVSADESLRRGDSIVGCCSIGFSENKLRDTARGGGGGIVTCGAVNNFPGVIGRAGVFGKVSLFAI